MKANNQRFLVAKYVEDVSRMEPRNIGVILCAAGRTEGRFLDKSSVPFIKDKRLFQRWVDFWMDQIGSDGIRMRDGILVRPSEPEFVQALLETQRGNYMLYDTGVIPDPLKKTEVPGAIDTLFAKLVQLQSAKRSHESSGERQGLARVCREIFEGAGISERKDFATKQPVICKVGGGNREFLPHYALLRRGKPLTVWHRVDVSSVRDVDSAAFMFEKLHKNRIVKGVEHCGAMIHGDLKEGAIEGAIETLEEVSTVINVDDPGEAQKLASRMAFKSPVA